MRHTIFWLVVFIAWTFMKTGGSFTQRGFLFMSMNLPIYMCLFYLLKHIQLPKFYHAKRYMALGLSLVASSLLVAFAWFLVNLVWRGTYNIEGLLLETMQSYVPAMLLLAWDAHARHKQEVRIALALEKEKLSHELKLLKAQVNPNFLIDTLKSLHQKVLHKSPDAQQMILELSNMLDNILYKSQKNKILLTEEIDTIKHYLKLEELRHSYALKINYNIETNGEEKVSPLILLSLVQGVLRQHTTHDREERLVSLNIQSSQQQIICVLTDSWLSVNVKDQFETTALSKLKRQLDIVYPTAYQLSTAKKDQDSTIALTLFRHQ